MCAFFSILVWVLQTGTGEFKIRNDLKWICFLCSWLRTVHKGPDTDRSVCRCRLVLCVIHQTQTDRNERAVGKAAGRHKEGRENCRPAGARGQGGFHDKRHRASMVSVMGNPSAEEGI